MKLRIFAGALIILCLFTGCKSAGDKLVDQGIAALKVENYPEAIRFFNEARAEGINIRKEYDLDLNLADAYLKNQDYSNAIIIADEVIAENKTTGHYRAYNIKGVAQKNLKEYEAALKSFNEALAFSQNDIDTVVLYNNIATTYLSLNEPSASLNYLNSALLINTDFADTYGNLAITYALLFDFTSAEAALSDAEARDYTKVVEVQAIIDNYKNIGDSIPRVE